MGCVSSALLNHDDDFPKIGGSAAFSHHIVSLTSTTYGLLTLDPPAPPPQQRLEKRDSPPIAAIETAEPPPRLEERDSPVIAAIETAEPPPRVALGSLFSSPLSEPRSLRHQPLETINSWDLMSGLDSDHIPSFRFSPSPLPPSKPPNFPVFCKGNEENVDPRIGDVFRQSSVPNKELDSFLEGYEIICPPKGENRVVIYTTTLRGVRKTFEDCNAVRSAIQGLGISICERDISMDRGFRDELRELVKGKGDKALMIPPQVFVKGRYIGGVEEVMKIVEEGLICKLIQGLPKLKVGFVCEGCAGVGFLPCSTCHGSCKLVMEVKEGLDVGAKEGKKKTVVVKCSECNENGLVLCPICC